MTNVKNILAILVLLALISACNTFKGLGEDIQKGGKKLENAAHKEEPKKQPEQRNR